MGFNIIVSPCHCTKLAKVKLPESLAQIRLLSFYECSSLKEISLPESITNIGLQAFYGCPLTKIYSYNPVPPASGAFQLDPDAECTVIVPAGSGPAYLRLSAWAGLYNLEEADLAGNGSAAFTEWLAYTVNDDHTCSVRKALDVVPGVLTIPPSTTQGGETYTVTAIGSSAFSSCSELKEIEIPETVRDISEYAFSYCYSLKKVTIPNIQNIGRYAFSYCRNLQQMTIPGSIQTIGESAFSSCINLQQMTISGSIQTIGESAFSYYGTIKSVTIEAGENPVHIGDCVFRDSKIESLTIKKPWTFNVDKQSYPRNACFKNASAIKTVNVSEIPDYAFADCRIESATLIDSPTKIGDHAFSGSYLKSLTLPESIVSIGTEAFRSCDFSSLTIPESVIMIGDYAFDNGKIGSLTIAMRTISSRAFSSKKIGNHCSISSLSLTDNVNTIGAYAFERITGLSELVIPETVTRIREYAFKDSKIESVKIASNEIGYGAFSGCNMTSVSMSNAVTKIGNLAFNNCGHLTSVTLPESITEIGELTFNRCHRLTSVTLPESITEIPYATFGYCNELQSITIPESVTKIGKKAFEDCTSLQTITIPESVSAIGEYAFSGCISISSVSIPESVSGNHYNTFIGCSGLTTVYIKSASSDRENKARADETTPAEIFGGAALWLDCDNIREVYYDCEHPLEGSESLFSDDVYPNATLYVKESARLEAISTTPWGKFLKIKAHDFAGIENIADDNGISGPTEVYNLNGLKVGNSTDGLPAGLYIVRQGGTTTKTIVK